MPEKELTPEEVLHQEKLNDLAATPGKAFPLTSKGAELIEKHGNSQTELFREVDKLLDQQAGGGGGGTPKTVGDHPPQVEKE